MNSIDGLNAIEKGGVHEDLKRNDRREPINYVLGREKVIIEMKHLSISIAKTMLIQCIRFKQRLENTSN